MGGGYTPKNLPRVFKGLRTLKASAFHACPDPIGELACRSRVICGGRSSRWCGRRRPVGAPLRNDGKRPLSPFCSYRCQTFSLTTRGVHPPLPLSSAGLPRLPRSYRGPGRGPLRRILPGRGALLTSWITGHRTRDTCSSACTSRHFASFRRYFRPVVV
jgi:hypothetical protein